MAPAKQRRHSVLEGLGSEFLRLLPPHEGGRATVIRIELMNKEAK